VGFYFRKSVRFGPFRVNFSKSGIGLSAGIPGFRIGTGPRGNYVQAGAHGFYYRAALPRRRSKLVRTLSAPGPEHPPTTHHAPILDGTTSQFTAIESVDADRIVDSSSEALLRTIEENHRRITWWRFVVMLAGAALIVSWANGVPGWGLGLLGMTGVVLATLTYKWDLERKLTILHYDLDAESSDAFGRLIDAGQRLQQCRRMWHLKGQAHVLKRKYHAGAAVTVSRASATAAAAQPSYMACNLDPVSAAFSHLTLYFFPDRVLVYQGRRVGAISYGNLNCNGIETSFVESEGVPADAEVVGRTWQYVNKNGTPDRRFRNNREFPICRYSELALQSDSGLNEVLLFSRSAAAAEFIAAIEAVRRTALRRYLGKSLQQQDAEKELNEEGYEKEGSDGDDERDASGAGRLGHEPLFVAARIVGGIILLALASLWAYYHFSRSLPNTEPQRTASIPFSETPAARPEPRRHRSSSSARTISRPPTSVANASESVKSKATTARTEQQSKSVPPSVVENDTSGDLEPVQAKDPDGATRILSYCNAASRDASDVASAAAACRRNEVNAWTRLVLNNEFPELDEEVRAKCGRPPFPDSYEGREACFKYELEGR
jgi:hypothetical protein